MFSYLFLVLFLPLPSFWATFCFSNRQKGSLSSFVGSDSRSSGLHCTALHAIGRALWRPDSLESSSLLRFLMRRRMDAVEIWVLVWYAARAVCCAIDGFVQLASSKQASTSGPGISAPACASSWHLVHSSARG